MLESNTVLFDIFINTGSSSGHFMPVLAGEKQKILPIVLVDGKKVITPGLDSGK